MCFIYVMGYFSLLDPFVPSPCFALQIIFHKENPGVDYEFFVPVDKKDAERERLLERERETPRNTPRERLREREPGRVPLHSKNITPSVSGFFPSLLWQPCAATPLSVTIL